MLTIRLLRKLILLLFYYLLLFFNIQLHGAAAVQSLSRLSLSQKYYSIVIVIVIIMELFTPAAMLHLWIVRHILSQRDARGAPYHPEKMCKTTIM